MSLALITGVAPVAQVSAGASGIDLWFYTDFTDFGLVAIGSSVTRTIEYQNNGEGGGTLDVFIQPPEQDQFSAPATIDVAPQSYGSFEVTFTPLRLGQASTGIAVYTGSEVWGTQIGGMALYPAADNAEDAVQIVVGEGETFYYATDTNWATTADIEASCGISNAVWLKYTATIDSVLTFISGPVGEVRDGELVSCSSGGWLPYTVLAGTTIYFFIGTGGQPGWLDAWARVQPLPHIDLQVTKATVDRSGALTVTGTGTNQPDGDVYLGIIARQKSGHGYISAAEGPWAYWMTGTKSTWSFTLRPTGGGKFVAGPVSLHLEGTAPEGMAYGGTTLDVLVKANAGK